MEKNTAILVFSRSARAESCIKKLHSNPEQNKSLHQALYNKTLLVVKETGLPFILVDEQTQNGKNFGEKYCNALEYSFSQGFEKIISVGTDCAALTTEDLLNANFYSQVNNLVGADNNGGFYLFALHKEQYNRKDFLNLKWCSSQLIKNIFSFFTKNNFPKPTIFQKKYDANSINDLANILRVKNVAAFLKLLFKLFNKVSNGINFFPLKKDNLYLHNFSLRGPPFLIAFSL